MHAAPWPLLLLVVLVLAVHVAALVQALRSWTARVRGTAQPRWWTAATLGVLGYGGLVVLGTIAVALMALSARQSADHEQRARLLAEGIAAVMNMAALGIFTLPLSIAFIVIGRRRARR